MEGHKEELERELADELFYQEHDPYAAKLLRKEDDVIEHILHPEHFRVGVIRADQRGQVAVLGENSVTFGENGSIELDGFPSRPERPKAYPSGPFAPTSTSVDGASVKTHSTVETVSDRLFNNEKKIKKVKTADDALLSSLPTDSLRWIKKRRKINSFEKVALTHFRERQLRNIFRGLDFDGMGTIHLDLVKDAANYAEEKLRPKKGKPVFTNIQGMFAAMDEDGDGTVDFHEFTIAMTGSSKSAMDNATEQDVEKLTRRFIEFANIRRRERAAEATKFPLSMVEEQKRRVGQMFEEAAERHAHAHAHAHAHGHCHGHGHGHGHGHSHGHSHGHRSPSRRPSLDALVETEPDLPRYQHFRTLFSIGAKVSEAETEEMVRQEVERMNQNVAAASAGHKITANDTLLARFHAELAETRTREMALLTGQAEAAPDDPDSPVSQSQNENRKHGHVEPILSAEEAARHRKLDEEMEATALRVRDLRIKAEDEARRDPEVREMFEKIVDERRYVREMKKCPWLPPVKPSAVTAKPTLIPHVPSPVKREIQVKLQTRKDAQSVKGRPEDVEVEKAAYSRSQSLKALNSRAKLMEQSLVSSHAHVSLSSIGSRGNKRNFRDKKIQNLLRYNFDD